VQRALDGVDHGRRTADEIEPVVAGQGREALLQNGGGQLSNESGPVPGGLRQHVIDRQVQALAQALDLVAIENLGLDAVAVDEPQRVPIAVPLELPQDAHDRCEADTAGDEDDALGLPSGQAEDAVGTVEIGPGAGSDRADPVGEIAAFLDGEADAGAVGRCGADRERMLGQAERRMAEVEPSELAGGEGEGLAALRRQRQLPGPVGDLAVRQQPIGIVRFISGLAI